MARALLVDDEPLIRSTLARLCSELELESETAADGVEALGRLGDGHTFDLVILDLSMPRLDGFGVLEELRKRQGDAMPAVIVVTAQADFSGRSRGTALGAIDFVEKPFRSDELRRRIQRCISITDLEKKLREAEVVLANLRATDPATGFGSFGKLQRALETEFLSARLNDRPLTCVVVSDERFSLTVQAGGEAAGAERLQVLAKLIEERLRGADQVFRVDAAEFVLLLPATPTVGARRVVDKITELADGIDILRDHQIAIGVATYPHPEIQQASALYRAANVTLAQARTRERQRIAYFEGF